MVSVSRKVRMIKELSRNKIVCFGEEITGTDAINPKNLSWVRVSVKIFSVSQKLMVMEYRYDRNCLFRRGDYRNSASVIEKFCNGQRNLSKVV
jgi:hypothetical protein